MAELMHTARADLTQHDDSKHHSRPAREESATASDFVCLSARVDAQDVATAKWVAVVRTG